MLGFGLSLLFGFLPMFFLAAIIYWLDRYEKEPKLLLGGVFAWGAIVAVVGALILQIILGEGVLMLTGSSQIEDVVSSSLFAPVTEEALKGLAVLLVFLFFRREFDSILDGIVYAAVVALGFAATEDVLYYFSAYNDQGLGGLLISGCLALYHLWLAACLLYLLHRHWPGCRSAQCAPSGQALRAAARSGSSGFHALPA